MKAPVRGHSVQVTPLGLACFLCGAAIGVKLDFVGDLHLLEPLAVLLAVQVVLSRGSGKSFVPRVFFGFLVAGLITFCGYLLADLVAENEPWQYLKGWGRVALLIVDSATIMILAAHGRQNLWWLVLGVAVGGISALAIEGVPLTNWKLGYGEYVALLVVTLVPLVPPVAAIPAIGAFGGFCIALDYRNLGAACILVAGAMAWQTTAANGSRALFLRCIALAAVFTLVLATLALMLDSTEEDYRTRREASNVGRYVGVLVAWRAILESPIVGYGSWAIADQKYTRMIRDEVLSRIDSPAIRNYVENHPVRSLMPHSQLIQAWLEAGILGLAFFLLYGVRMAQALHWFAMRHPLDAIVPMFVFFLVQGGWNLVGSPFLGIHRVYIAVAVAVTMLAVHQRTQIRRAA